MVSAREIQAVAELLQISPEGLQKAITFKVTVSPWGTRIYQASCRPLDSMGSSLCLARSSLFHAYSSFKT